MGIQWKCGEDTSGRQWEVLLRGEVLQMTGNRCYRCNQPISVSASPFQPDRSAALQICNMTACRRGQLLTRCTLGCTAAMHTPTTHAPHPHHPPKKYRKKFCRCTEVSMLRFRANSLYTWGMRPGGQGEDQGDGPGRIVRIAPPSPTPPSITKDKPIFHQSMSI